MSSRVILTAKQIQDCLQNVLTDVMAGEDFASGEYAIIGIRTRGVTLARRLHERIQAKIGKDIDFGILDITLYRDDLDQTLSAPVVQSTAIDFNVENKKIILVDDVLYTGRTIRAALDAIIDYGRPRFIKLAVLIDRGERELPIEAQYVGKKISVEKGMMVQLFLADQDNGREEAVLTAATKTK